MQGLPINFITQKLGQKNVQSESVNANKAGKSEGNLEAGIGEEGNLFANLLSKLTSEHKEISIDGKKPSSKNANPENIEALLEEVQKNGIHFDQNDLNKAVKLASANTNLDELIRSLKNPSTGQAPVEFESAKLQLNGTNQQIPVGNEEVITDEVDTKLASPLDFLMKESKPKLENETSLNKLDKNSEVLKGFVSSEDFIGLKKDSKEIGKEAGKENLLAKLSKSEEGDKLSNLELSSIFKKNNIVSNPYAAGKTGVMSDHVIKNTRDLAFNDKKSNINSDELKNSDLKVSSELSLIKESFIPQVNATNTNNSVEVANAGNVLDLSKLNTSNTNEIIKNISNYIEQNQIMNKDSLDLNVHHDELGSFKIQVTKNSADNKAGMDMQIITTTAEGHEFFARNEIPLMKTLSQAGIQLQDFKIVSSNETMSFAQSDSRQNGQSQSQGQMNQKDFMGQNPDRNNGSERRKELWEEANRNFRFGA